MLRERQAKWWITTLELLASVLRSMPLPYGIPPARPRKLVPIDLPDSIACRARYRRIDSGISLQSSPFSMLFLAIFLILARLCNCQYCAPACCSLLLPVLEPDLDRSLGHVNFRGYSFAGSSSRSGVLVELDFECHQLVLSGPLSLLVSLLLGEGAFPRWSARGRALRRCRGSRRWGWRGRDHCVVAGLHVGW